MSDKLREALVDRLRAALQCGANCVISPSEARQYVAALAKPQNDAEAVALYQCELEDGTIDHSAGCFGEVLEINGVRVVKQIPLYTAPPPSSRMRRALEIAKGRLTWAANAEPGVRTPEGKALVLSWVEEIDEALRAGDNHASDGKESEGGVEGHAKCDSPIRSVPVEHPKVAESRNEQGHDADIAGIKPGPSEHIPSDDLGAAPLERIRTEAARLGYALVPNDHTPTRIKNRIDSHLNAALCEMKPNHDDSISGFNDAWDIVRMLFDEARRERE